MYQVVDTRPVQCSKCKSRDIARTVERRRRWVCLSCGHREELPMTVTDTETVVWTTLDIPDVIEF